MTMRRLSASSAPAGTCRLFSRIARRTSPAVTWRAAILAGSSQMRMAKRRPPMRTRATPGRSWRAGLTMRSAASVVDVRVLLTGEGEPHGPLGLGAGLGHDRALGLRRQLAERLLHRVRDIGRGEVDVAAGLE